MKFIAINYDNTKYTTLLTHEFFSPNNVNSFTINHTNELTTINVDGNLTDDFLRFMVSDNFGIPDEITYMKITEEIANSKIPTEPYDLGDGRKIFKNQYKVEEANDEYYCIVGRTSTVKQIVGGVEVEVPTGNWQGSLSFDIFNAFIDTFGIDNLYIKLPEVELED